MKTKAGNILSVLKVIALLGGIGYSIECGSQLLALIASFINPDWAKRVYYIDQNLFSLREHSILFFIYAMSLVIALSALKAVIWYLLFDLLLKIKLTTPFTMEVAKKLEKIAYLLLGVWVISIIARAYFSWLSKSTSLPLGGSGIGDEYLFIAGIAFIVSQVFKRGIEIQEENQLTV